MFCEIIMELWSNDNSYEVRNLYLLCGSAKFGKVKLGALGLGFVR